jgi:serine/threonine-protein phosphatase 5
MQDEEVVLVSSTIDLSNMDVEDSFKGPRMKGNNKDGYVIDLEFVKDMLQEMKEQRLVHRRFAFEILLKAQSIFQSEASLVDISIPADQHFTVCGDVHGQYYDLLNIWDINGLPSDTNPYLFNGDFVDRGSFSVEVIFALLAFKVELQINSLRMFWRFLQSDMLISLLYYVM